MTLWVTVQAFKEQYKDISSSTDDDFIAVALQAAQDTIEGPGVGINRVVLDTADSTRYMDAVGASVDGLNLYVSDIGDLSAITTLTNGDGSVLTANTHYTTYPKTLTTANPSYDRLRLLPAGGKIWDYTTDWENAITITGKWAMWATAAAVPDSFKLSVMELAAFMLETRKSQVFDTVVIPDAGVITVPSGFPASVMARLKGWRRLA
jgi:hypothetical protein